MKAIEQTIERILAQLTREELITLAHRALNKAQEVYDIQISNQVQDEVGNTLTQIKSGKIEMIPFAEVWKGLRASEVMTQLLLLGSHHLTSPRCHAR